MNDWLKIVLTALGTLVGGIILTALAAGISRVWHLGTTVTRVEQKLDDHIAAETTKFDEFRKNLDRIESKLPNGDLGRILDKLSIIDRKLNGGK